MTLEGIRVLELGALVAGPFIGTLLGEFGAQVIKIERPGRGDVLRQFGPIADGESLYPERFSYVQRVNRRDPDLAALFAILGSSPGCRSLRIDVREPAENQASRDGGYDELLTRVSDRSSDGRHAYGRAAAPERASPPA